MFSTARVLYYMAYIIKLYILTTLCVCECVCVSVCVHACVLCVCVCVCVCVTGFVKPIQIAKELKSHLLLNIKLLHYPETPNTWLQMAKSAFTDRFLLFL